MEHKMFRCDLHEDSTLQVFAKKTDFVYFAKFVMMMMR
jgi:hypothetical protein